MANLEERLTPKVLSLFQLSVFFRKLNTRKLTWLQYGKLYNELLHGPHISMVLLEFVLWVTKWKREAESGNTLPEYLPQGIEQCDTDLYPNIRVLLQILAMLPVSATIAEQSFSTLRHLKSWLPSNMREERHSQKYIHKC